MEKERPKVQHRLVVLDDKGNFQKQRDIYDFKYLPPTSSKKKPKQNPTTKWFPTKDPVLIQQRQNLKTVQKSQVKALYDRQANKK